LFGNIVVLRSNPPGRAREASIVDISAGRRAFTTQRLSDELLISDQQPDNQQLSGAVLLGSTPFPAGRLTEDDVRAIFRLRKIIQTDLAARSSLLLNRKDLDRVERAADVMLNPRTDILTITQMYIPFVGGLLRPAASHTELSTMLALINRTDDHFRTELARLDIHHTELPERGDDFHGLVDAFRNTDPQRVTSEMLRHLEQGEQLALSLLAHQQPPRLTVVGDR
jgi:FCD domain